MDLSTSHKKGNILEMKEKTHQNGLVSLQDTHQSVTPSHVRGNHVRVLGEELHSKCSPKYRDISDLIISKDCPGNLMGVTD